jgi:hypothetical protein
LSLSIMDCRATMSAGSSTVPVTASSMAIVTNGSTSHASAAVFRRCHHGCRWIFALLALCAI